MRPNFFANTPDILPAHLQHGGSTPPSRSAPSSPPPSPHLGHLQRLRTVREHPLREGGEEYLDSEKYQLKPRDWDAAAREGRTIAP